MELPPILCEPPAGPAPLPLGAQLISRQVHLLTEAGLPREEVVITWELEGDMDESRMVNVLNSHAERREIFQLHLEERSGQGVIQKVPPEPIRLEILAEGDLPETLERWSVEPIPPGKASCTRRLFRLAAGRYLLGLRGGHELFDMFTFEQFIHQIAADYNDDRRGRMPERAAPPGFPGFSQWHASLLADGLFRQSELYWERLLAGSGPAFTRPPSLCEHPVRSHRPHGPQARIHGF